MDVSSYLISPNCVSSIAPSMIQPDYEDITRIEAMNTVTHNRRAKGSAMSWKLWVIACNHRRREGAKVARVLWG